MIDSGRIPTVRDDSRKAMNEWCGTLADRGLLFHPDDPPDSIEYIETGRPMFTTGECKRLEQILDRFMDRHGTDVYEVCLYHAQRHLGIPPG